MEDLIREWDGEMVLTHFDRPTGTWMFIAIHSTTLGIAAGGTRLKSYSHPREALRPTVRRLPRSGNPVRVHDLRDRAKSPEPVPRLV